MNRLKKLRNKAGLSQNKLVSSFNNYLAKSNNKGITVATYSRWENSNNSPTKEMWKHLADYFNVSVPYIRGDIDKELITKIAKMVTYISNTNYEIRTSRVTYPDNEIGKSIAIDELMLLIIKELGTSPKLKWINTVFDRSDSSESDYDIQNAQALVELYDKICKKIEEHEHEKN